MWNCSEDRGIVTVHSGDQAGKQKRSFALPFLCKVIKLNILNGERHAGIAEDFPHISKYIF